MTLFVLIQDGVNSEFFQSCVVVMASYFVDDVRGLAANDDVNAQSMMTFLSCFYFISLFACYLL